MMYYGFLVSLFDGELFDSGVEVLSRIYTSETALAELSYTC
jgi:hypothetical protein